MSITFKRQPNKTDSLTGSFFFKPDYEGQKIQIYSLLDCLTIEELEAFKKRIHNSLEARKIEKAFEKRIHNSSQAIALR